MTYDSIRALELLRTGSGSPSACFRDGQEEAISHLVENRGRLLVVQKTGWGKSFVYFIAAKLLREAEQGPTLLISPLLALMRNQIDAATRMGVRAASITSENVDEWATVEAQIAAGELDVLLISPERLANPSFATNVLAPMASRVALLVVDEAHCISDWGHDFRPDYRLIERIVRRLPPNVRFLATTATANQRVIRDLTDVLGPDLHIQRGTLGRPSLYLQTVRLPSQAERLAWLAQVLPTLPGSGIVYTLTKRDAHRVADWLRTHGLDVRAYTRDQEEERADLEQALLRNEVKALSATLALGMGFDKPDLKFVVHFQTPASVVAYYQQVGRAGRAVERAYGIALSGTEETEITDHFIDMAFPSRVEVRRVVEALEAHPAGLSVPELLAVVNLGKARIEQTLKCLSLESPAPVVKVGPKWQLTTARVPEALWERAERITTLRRAEQQQMQAYVDLTEGHMEFLIDALDGDLEDVDTPDLPSLPRTADPELTRAAIDFLRRSHLPIEPRKRWPVGGLPRYGLASNSMIPAALQAQQGMALGIWRDAGWGTTVYEGKHRDGHLSDDLVHACVDMYRTSPFDPRPEWVTCVPSLRHPTIVPDFAKRLASELGLPYVESFLMADARPEQKGMANETQGARNVDGAFTLVGTPRSGPVLLVDDVVNSRWTLTVCAWLLRRGGCGEVWPLALATTR